jgi:DUF4097 and DUF4098 domain-containing protein YvlB
MPAAFAVGPGFYLIAQEVIMNKLAAQILRVALLISVCSPALGQDCKFSSDRTANFTGPIKKVVVSAAAGYLNIRGDAAGGLTAKGRACASSEALVGKITLESRREGDIVYLTVMMPEGVGDVFSFGRYTSLDLDVTVPKTAQLEVNDSSGDIELSEVGASVVTDSSGDMLLKNINGDLQVNDSAGEIRIVSVIGNVRVEDSSGGIDIEDARADVTIVSDSSGDIAIAKVAGSVRVIDDSSGDINVREVKGDVNIENDTSGDIRVSEVGGKFRVNADSSGTILHDRVAGGVRIPAKT